MELQLASQNSNASCKLNFRKPKRKSSQKSGKMKPPMKSTSGGSFQKKQLSLGLRPKLKLPEFIIVFKINLVSASLSWFC